MFGAAGDGGPVEEFVGGGGGGGHDGGWWGGERWGIAVGFERRRWGGGRIVYKSS